ncbi:arabinosyltransferase domain-containing protein [Mycolicibacter arupensis]|uniref:Arabinosyltransferase n=1 Tax=Mycolicibacter arupensis TaxID=342002 RepID=A0A0F5MXN8_9MYCO|nr:arabinosyltransferase domain-containing protein [Mycolicibacter arupensis]KKB98792.1 arabinosyltransferase [Mycolicibacter arupensis]MCV7274095.1 arabinosyltransferase [Mycolicibacter arupensis]OQZ96257.1 arabinosyltransferase [Mycolicibacter arupensis]
MSSTYDQPRQRHRFARLIAVVAGVTGVLLCGITPLLPVNQTTATIAWPQGVDADGHVADVTAPLVSGAPQSLDITIPCSAMATLGEKGGLVLSTVPAGGVDATAHGLFVRANKTTVFAAYRDQVAAAAPRSKLADCSELHLWAGAGGVGADFVGIPGAAGTLPPENKPQIGGVFTELQVGPQPGLNARIDIDTRFISGPTPLKTAVMALGVLAVLASIVALAVLDGPRRRRSRSTVHPVTRLADVGVLGTLALWHVIGAISSDDGYNLTMARNVGHAGYVANYYRFFGASEAPFDWYPALLGQLSTISTAGVWMRLPATLAGMACWLIISRRILPRLGRLSGNRVAVFTAAAMFAAAWLPFNNGLRPEPLIALGTLVVWVLVERTIATRRLVPTALAILVAVFTVTLAPHGLIALAPLLTGSRAIETVIRRRRAVDGLAAPLAVLAAAASVLAVVVCRSQSLAAVAESARIKYVVGPTIAWYQEFLRYYFLTVEENVDASLTRRFAVLVLLFCMFAMLVVLLRRGRISGVASGPAWRLIGTCAVGLLLLTFTPTKWAVQFGGFAGLAGALGALTAFTFARVGLHSRRNMTLYVTALLFLVAVSTSGVNGWFYVGGYGVPWFDIPPVIASKPVTSMFLAASIATGLLAGWQHFRLDYSGHTQVTPNRRNRILASTPLLIVASLMVLLMVGSMAKAAAGRYPAYTTAKANAEAVLSGVRGSASCSMADDVLAEPDTNAGLLQPIPGQKYTELGPLGGADPYGFDPNSVDEDLTSLAVIAKPGVPNADASPNKPSANQSDAAGTAGGKIPDDAPDGVNGSRVALPFGLDPALTPVLGSYKEQVAAHATSVWYRLPEQSKDRAPIVVVSAAGAIWSHGEDGKLDYGQPLKLEWGTSNPDGTFTALGEVEPIDIGPQNSWRNLRFPLAWAPPGTNAVRIVANDPNLSTEQWIAFTPPRVPVVKTISELMGSQTPVLMDIAVAANFPCQRPFAEHLGVAELPEYRIMPDHKQTAASSNLWQSAEDGGPFMITQAMLWTTTVPTYLRNDWYRDWGAVEAYHRLIPAAEAPDAVIEQGTVTVAGWSRPGPIRALP